MRQVLVQSRDTAVPPYGLEERPADNSLPLIVSLTLPVVVTNHVMADPGNMFVSDAKKPIGGNLLGAFE